MEVRSRKDLYFIPEEDELLISLISQHKNIIENKITDANGWREKQVIWGKIATMHEEKTGKNRSVKSLQNRYKYLKRNLRKKIMIEEENLYRTGDDGPSFFMKFTSNEEQLLHILKDHLAVGMANHFDNDRLDAQNTTPFSEDDVQTSTTFTEDEISVTLDEGVILESGGKQAGIQAEKAEKSGNIEPPEAESPLPAPSNQHKRKRETVTAQDLAKAKVDFLQSEKRIKLEQHESKKQIKLESHEMRQALRKAKLDLLQAKLKLLVAKTREIDEKEKKCDECKNKLNKD